MADKVLQHIRGGYIVPVWLPSKMIEYIHYGRESGSCFNAIIRNDFKETLGQADHITFQCLKGIAIFMYNVVPTACYGTVERVEKWMQMEQSERDLFFDTWSFLPEAKDVVAGKAFKQIELSGMIPMGI